MSLGKADLLAATVTKVYTCPTGKSASVSANMCNRNSTAARIRIAIAAADTPVASEYIEYDYLLPASQTIERTCLILNAGDRVLMYSDLANVSGVVLGFED